MECDKRAEVMQKRRPTGPRIADGTGVTHAWMANDLADQDPTLGMLFIGRTFCGRLLPSLVWMNTDREELTCIMCVAEAIHRASG